mmetsp:Transcript_4121/g.6259  ORF Transcript_4121/g.6259 Transcript_4121/m.6259 type:complete len:220 (+) Transcript_4121:270-929(+)
MTSSRRSIGIVQAATNIVSILLLVRLQKVTSFSTTTTTSWNAAAYTVSGCHRQPFLATHTYQQCRFKKTMLLDRRYYDDDEDDDDEEEYARVRRRRGGGSRGYDRDEVEAAAEYVSRRESSAKSSSKGKYYDDDEEEYENDDEYDYYDEDDEDDDDEEDFDDILIPNSQLDSMDPDGAAERFGELASDPKFWFEFTLFVLFYNFILYLGRDIDISYMVN